MNNDSKRWHRSWNLNVTKEQVREMIKNTTPEEMEETSLRGPYTPADTDAFTGKTLVFRSEGRVLKFEFTGLNTLDYTENGRLFSGMPVHVLSTPEMAAEGIYLAHILLKGTDPLRNLDLVADLGTGNATVCLAQIGTEYSNRDVGRDFLFGRFDGDYPKAGPLHGFTSDLVGKAVVWTYSDSDFEVRHIYTTNHFYTYTMDMPQGTWVASNPADFLKINDHVYVFTLVEERQPGVQLFFVMDFSKMKDVGGCFGVDARDKFGWYVCGAKGRLMPPYQVFTGK